MILTYRQIDCLWFFNAFWLYHTSLAFSSHCSAKIICSGQTSLPLPSVKLSVLSPTFAHTFPSTKNVCPFPWAIYLRRVWNKENMGDTGIKILPKTRCREHLYHCLLLYFNRNKKPKANNVLWASFGTTNLLLVFTKVCSICCPDYFKVCILTSFNSMLKCYLSLEPVTLKSQCTHITCLSPWIIFSPQHFYLLTQSMFFLKLFSACFIPLDWKLVPQRQNYLSILFTGSLFLALRPLPR